MYITLDNIIQFFKHPTAHSMAKARGLRGFIGQFVFAHAAKTSPPSKTINPTGHTMPPILIIVESPNKSKKIDEMFQGRFKAIATYGHICDLPKSPTDGGIGIDRDRMEGQYELTSDSKRNVDGKRTVAKLAKYLKDNPGTQVYLASDEDREGESIAAFVAHYLKLKHYKRMRFNAITKEKIEAAFNKAGDIDWAAVESREARRLIDRIIGYVASPVLWRMIKQKGVAAGRVQTAVEALVIERERKIRAHTAQAYYTVHCDLGGWEAQWQIPDSTAKRTGPKTNAEYDIDDTANRCTDITQANAVAALPVLRVQSCKETIETRLPPSPLHTFAMIQLANKMLDWDAEYTMKVAQKLFEGDGSGHGHITYHRTDSPNLDPMAAEEIRALLRSQGLPVPETPNAWTAKNKQAQEGHEAIRPAYLEHVEAGSDQDQKALYRLIRERAINSQLAPAQYSAKRIILTDANQGPSIFTASARTLVDPGWLGTAAGASPLMAEDADGEQSGNEKKAPVLTLPNIETGRMINVQRAEVKTHSTKTPPRYTISTLTSKLEKLSIGRPATIASLLKNVQTKGTIQVLKNKTLAATTLAEACYDILYPRFTFSNIGYTAELELALDKIGDGDLEAKALASMVWARLDLDVKATFDGGHKQTQ